MFWWILFLCIIRHSEFLVTTDPRSSVRVKMDIKWRLYIHPCRWQEWETLLGRIFTFLSFRRTYCHRNFQIYCRNIRRCFKTAKSTVPTERTPNLCIRPLKCLFLWIMHEMSSGSYGCNVSVSIVTTHEDELGGVMNRMHQCNLPVCRKCTMYYRIWI